MVVTDSLIDPASQTGLIPAPLFVGMADTLDILHASGSDAFTFLQGQVTCDMQEVNAGHWRLGAHCNAKGRAQSTFIALKRGEEALLLLPAGMGEPTLQQLKKYALFSKVTLQVNSRPLQAGVIGGADAADWLAAHGLPSPESSLASTDSDWQTARWTAASPLTLALAPPDAWRDLLAMLPPGTPVIRNGWWECMTALGYAHVSPALQEQFIPQELNYDLIHGISFKKGCYKGQEIIARLYFRGTPKVRTRLYQCEGDAPDVGTTLHADDGTSVGHVVQMTGLARARFVLAAVRCDLPEDATLVCEAHPASRLRPRTLPSDTTRQGA